jgi:hypothetical protein
VSLVISLRKGDRGVMGFKVDSSFLQFLTMGALGTKRVAALMRESGMEPIELERYSSCNKIWSTKVKRLRLPDLLCLRSGVRVEVRAKSKLEIKMSDAPDNRARRWFAGLRPEDLIAFVHCWTRDGGELEIADNAEVFSVSSLLECDERQTKLGPPKSASEGAERDRTWPSTVAKHAGTARLVSRRRIAAELATGRRQTYQMRGKTPYVTRGEAFVGKSQFIAGLPGEKLSFAGVAGRTWDPCGLIESENKADRYAAVKALGHIGREEDVGMLLSVAAREEDGRVALEAAAGAARLGSQEGFDRLMSTLREPPEPFLTMEAVLILTELGREAELRERCGSCLRAVAGDDTYRDSEVRLASLWGLGKAGCRDYRYLAGLLGSDSFDEDVHLVSAFGSRLADNEIDALVEVLLSAEASDRQKSSAAYVLMVADPTEYVVSRLADLMSSENRCASDWAAAVLGQMRRSCVEQSVGDETMLRRIRPAQLLSAELNWTRDAAQSTRLDFVQRQDMF